MISDQTRDSTALAARCLSIDLEVGRDDLGIHAFAAVRGDNDRALVHRGQVGLAEALARLDHFAEGADFLLGHNIVAFDGPHLAAAQPNLRLLRLPMIDTLRLNPLAFPRHPYHRLVKHYQDGRIDRWRRNDPELDSRLVLHLLGQQQHALTTLEVEAPQRLAAWHGLVASAPGDAAVDVFFAAVRGKPRPAPNETRVALDDCLTDRACATRARALLSHARAHDARLGEAQGADAPQHGWPLAYALAWLSVAGGNSVLPPWVLHQFPEAGRIVRKLRDLPCGDAACRWCAERHDARHELRRWFALDQFRPEPRGDDGRPLQQAIAEAAMRGENALGILPTGTGKSLCYQLPALSRYDKTGALTVVVSPLVALMADQVAGLEARGIGCGAALNGLLSMPERADVLDRLRLGDIGILIVSPEQLRGRALRRMLMQREIGAWVLDEAHCLSKWGHDFRPDYRYVGRYIRERAGNDAPPPVLCLTATAKPDVVSEIRGYFRQQLGIELALYDGGSSRDNLDFEVVPTGAATKLDHIHQLLIADLPPEAPGGAIVYCASRARTEEVAQFLRAKGLAAGHFHAGLAPTTKKATQQAFIAGDLRVMVATNAFGMGIDKPDVRLVIHADVPGSLENYLQEAGRAGRDRAAARCVLLYAEGDVERQFGLSARSRLTQREIAAILRSLRGIDKRKRLEGEVVVTAGEILREDREGEFQRDSVSDDTRVRTAIAWLEEAKLLSREENHVQMFPSSLRIASLDTARERLARAGVPQAYRASLIAIVDTLMRADADEGVSTDVLMGVSRLGSEGVRKALFDLEAFGLASNDLAITAFVHVGVERPSAWRFEQAAALEGALLDALREAAPDLGLNQTSLLHLRHASQRLKDAGHPHALPETLWRIVRSLAADGRGEEGGVASLGLRPFDSETVELRLQRTWGDIERTAQLRRAAAGRLLEHLLACVPAATRGTDLLAATTLGKLAAAMQGDLDLRSRVRQPQKLLDHALLWLHEQEVIRLSKGLAVFRPAMTIRLASEKRSFAKSDFAPLALHYDELVLQIHVMAEYAQRGLEAMADALRLTVDYFTLQRDDFMRRWLPEREKELARQTTPQSWAAIVEALDNPAQQRIVADDRAETNVLVLAGPGSGKTRVLVHRIAYLLRVRRENPRGIIALAYNRHAAVQIRRRLRELVGEDANGVTVLTCHALAMRIAGVAFEGRAEGDSDIFAGALQQAVDLLEGKGLPEEDRDEMRDRLLAGFRWIFVDEYQDIGPGQYQLISALAGKKRADEDGKLNLFAVGDDDQNIYAWSGASVEFIRRFEADYAARPAYLTDNYRSTAHIIEAANRLVEPARERLKCEQPITIDRARRKLAAGGRWQRLDPVARGRVQLLPACDSTIAQAVNAVDELRRLAALDPAWDWSRCAVIARQWKVLEPVRACCEQYGIPVQMADEEMPPLWRLRETQALRRWWLAREQALIDAAAISTWIAEQAAGRWWELLAEAAEAYELETEGAELPLAHWSEWLAEWGRELRRRQSGLLLASAHRAKGLEFDHVVVLDGGWDESGAREGGDAPRRLYYVAMTRARQTLALGRLGEGTRLLRSLDASDAVLDRGPLVPSLVLAPELSRRYRRLTPADIDLGFAGRHGPASEVHAAIAALRSGEPIGLRREGDRWLLCCEDGEVVGRLARSFTLEAGYECVAASVAAVLVRRREDTPAQYLDALRCDAWEVVLPELVLQPVSTFAPALPN